jgi:hypothetical protein
MAQAWKTIRVFISSTFRNMHAERDHLVRFVLPELRERCAKRRLHLVDVDLRWGVTEEEAEQGKVLEVCLNEIERCRPEVLWCPAARGGPAACACCGSRRPLRPVMLPPCPSVQPWLAPASLCLARRGHLRACVHLQLQARWMRAYSLCAWIKRRVDSRDVHKIIRST